MTTLGVRRLLPYLALVVLVSVSAPASTVKAADSTSNQTLVKARALLDKDQNNAALVLLNALIRKEPKNTEAYCERAVAYRALGKNQNSLQDCTKAAQLAYWKSRPLLERGHTYIHLREYANAVENLTGAIQLDPQYFDAYTFRALAYEKLGLFTKEIFDLSSAIKVRPKDADLYERRARAHFQLGQMQKSIDDTNSAMKLKPTSPEAYGTAACAQESLGSHVKAIGLLTTYLKLAPKTAIAWGSKAILEDRAGRHDLAISDWHNVVTLGSAEEQVHLQLCSPLIDFHKPSESPREIIDKHLRVGPIVLPFQYDDTGHIRVPAQVNGHSLELMLDTGCDHSDLWKDKMAGIATVDKVQLRRNNAHGKEYQHGWFRAQSLKLGQVLLPNVAMEEEQGLVGHKTISGFLGGNILENFVVTVDYSKKQVILARSVDLDKAKSAIVVPMWVIDHRPHCSVQLDGKVDVCALLDTGDPTNTAPDSLLQPILSKHLSFRELSGGPWLGELHVENIRLKSVLLGQTRLNDPIFEVFHAQEAPAAASTITLGCSFLSRFKTVTFDYPGRQVLLQPNEKSFMSAPQLYDEGLFYHSQQEAQKAAEAYTKCMLSDADFASTCFFRRAWEHACLKQYQQALDDLNAAIKLDPQGHWSYDLRAWVNRARGEYQLAIADYTTEIRLQGTLPNAYRDRASVYEKLGMHALAKQDRKTAERLESKDGPNKAPNRDY